MSSCSHSWAWGSAPSATREEKYAARYRHARSRGYATRDFQKVVSREEQEVLSGSCETWVRRILGQPEPESVLNSGDGGVDFRLGPGGPEGNVKWTWRRGGRLIRPSNEEHILVPLYVLGTGLSVPELLIEGWAFLGDFDAFPRQPWGGEMLPTVPNAALRPVGDLLMLAEKYLGTAHTCWRCGVGRRSEA